MQFAYPRYHFLLLAPNLGAEWLFDAARQYWDRFRPTVITNTRLLYFIPTVETVALTALAYRDLMPALGVEMAQFAPHIFFDPIPADDFGALRAELNRRAELNYPFGTDVLQPGQTLPTFAPSPSIPTPRVPGGIPTRPPAGFITQTPEFAIAPSSTPIIVVTSFEGNADEIQPTPIAPTPGPITGS
ncbi:MAG: hypothetical protein SGI73_15820 [Chloroflexota bacterium]|nr:hypothetical protein [Chloroflexota bacterium]